VSPGVAITADKRVLQPHIMFLEGSHTGVATTGKVLHHIFFMHSYTAHTSFFSFCIFFGVGGLYWSLTFLLNLLEINLLTVSQMTSWESLA
jgi:hypothetical protein